MRNFWSLINWRYKTVIEINKWSNPSFGWACRQMYLHHQSVLGRCRCKICIAIRANQGRKRK